jgi:hypothetical protein
MADLQYDIILDPLDEMTTLYGDLFNRFGTQYLSGQSRELFCSAICSSTERREVYCA